MNSVWGIYCKEIKSVDKNVAKEFIAALSVVIKIL